MEDSQTAGEATRREYPAFKNIKLKFPKFFLFSDGHFGFPGFRIYQYLTD
jgi:hypothetical protein